MKYKKQLLKFLKSIILVIIILTFTMPIYASDPIDTWELVYCGGSQSSEVIYDIAYGHYTYVAVGNGDKLYYSYDSENWVPRNYGKSFTAVCYGQNQFVAIGYGLVGISDSGVNWAINTSGDSYGYSYGDIAYGNGIYVAVGSMPYQTNLTRGVYKTSTDGVNWTTYESKPGKSYSVFTKVDFINNQFVALVSGSPGMYTSTDGVNWTYQAINPQFNYGITSVAYGNGIYMAIIGEGTIMTSPNGVNWTDKGRIKSYFHSPMDLVYVNGVFVVSGYGYNYGETDYIYSSVTGDTWTKGATVSGPEYQLRLSVANNILFGTGDYLSIYKSGQLIPPSRPILIEANAGSDQVTLLWKDMSDNETSFKIFRSDGLLMDYKHINSVGANQVTYTDTGLQVGKTYTYMIIAYNNYGASSYSNALSATCKITIDLNVGNQIYIPLKLATPENLVAHTESLSSIRLTWDDKSGSESGYKIQRKPENGDFQLINIVDADQESFIDTGLEAGTTYYYRVQAYSSSSFSYYSNEAGATTDARLMISIPTQTFLPTITPVLIPLPITIGIEDADEGTPSYYDLLSFTDKGDISTWAREYVGEAYTAGIVNGNNNKFNPKASLTVAKLVKMVLAATDNDCVNGTTIWYDTWMDKASDFGIVTSSDHLLADANLTREQAAMIIIRTVEYINDSDIGVNVSSELLKINDANEITPIYQEYVAKAYSLGIFEGDTMGNFKPDVALNMEQSTKIILEMQGVLGMRD